MYRHSFTVVGSGPFPTDMLRYDACYPVRSEDAALVAREPAVAYGERHVYVRLAKLGATKQEAERVTAARWESFGWRVLTLADVGSSLSRVAPETTKC